MNVNEMNRQVGGSGLDEEINKLIESLSKKGETRRIAQLYPRQSFFVFDMLSYDLAYFQPLQRAFDEYFENNGGDKKNTFKSNIQELMEIYMDLSVSEVNYKEKNLIGILADIFKRKVEMEETQNERP